MEERIVKELANGKMTSVIWQFDGIRMGHGISIFNERSRFHTQSPADVVRLHFGLKGDYRFSYKQLGKTFDLIGGHHNLMYSREFEMEVENKTLHLETFGVQFPKATFIQFTENANERLKWFAGEVIEGRNVILSEKWGSISAPIQQVIQQIVHCKFSGEYKKLFLLSKCVELLVLCTDSCVAAGQSDEVYIKSRADKEKIIAARDFVNENITSPPTLMEVAREVGLNEYKLKHGFKETFQTTIFGYLTEQRLYLAHRYLCDTKKPVAEIAYETGYATAQHFNNAFKKKFGQTPFSIRKNPENAI